MTSQILNYSTEVEAAKHLGSSHLRASTYLWAISTVTIALKSMGHCFPELAGA